VKAKGQHQVEFCSILSDDDSFDYTMCLILSKLFATISHANYYTTISVPDVVNHAKFHQNQFRGFDSLRGWNLPLLCLVLWLI